MQTSTATGAAKAQLGPRAHALAAALNKQFGLTMRKTCRVLRLFAGLTLSLSGLSRYFDDYGYLGVTVDINHPGQAAFKTRARRSTNPALPYICALWPSAGSRAPRQDHCSIAQSPPR